MFGHIPRAEAHIAPHSVLFEREAERKTGEEEARKRKGRVKAEKGREAGDRDEEGGRMDELQDHGR